MTQDDFKIGKLGKCTIDSPVRDMFFVDDNELVSYETDPAAIRRDAPLGFERAGARKKIFHDPAWSKAAILMKFMTKEVSTKILLMRRHVR